MTEAYDIHVLSSWTSVGQNDMTYELQSHDYANQRKQMDVDSLSNTSVVVGRNALIRVGFVHDLSFYRVGVFAVFGHLGVRGL
jgi:hypothetical protein